MPKPSPLPRKYASLVDEAQGNLRLIAQKARSVIVHVETNPRMAPHVQSSLREIETLAYRTALDLAEIEVAGGCDSCPSAPPLTTVQAHLLVLADTLEQHATAARQAALIQPNCAGKDTGQSDPIRLTRNESSIRRLGG